MTGQTITDNYGKLYCLFALILLAIEWVQRDKEHALQLSGRYFTNSRTLRWGLYLILIILIITFTGHSQSFIYFQF